MEKVFEYRSAPSKGVIWVAAFSVAILFATIILSGALDMLWIVWTAGAVTIAWMALPKPVYGMRVDNTHLVLAAWRKPRRIALDDISHMRATGISDETQIALVYKSGEEEAVFAGDLPDIETLIAVMGERGVPVRGYF